MREQVSDRSDSRGSAPSQPTGPRIISPVLQFALLLSPVVMSCFFLVYSLTGWLLEGRDRLNWSIEAGGVALYVGLGISVYCVITGVFARWRGAAWSHPLIVSGIFHLSLAVALSVSTLLARQL